MSAPILTGFAPTVTFSEDAVNAAPALLDADVTLLDLEGDFDGGRVTVTGLLGEDRIAVRHQGGGPGQIGVSGSDITYGGIVIGSFSGGVGSAFTVTLNGAATVAAVEALIENLTYANVSDDPTATRTLVLNISDADGADLISTGRQAFTALGAADNPLDGLDAGSGSIPTFVDLDGDGDLDLVSGNADGTLAAFRNDGGTFTSLAGAANPFGAIDVGYSSGAAFADLDGDGDLDMLVGDFFGGIHTFRNQSGVFTELTGAANPFNGVALGQRARPFFVDVDTDGDLDVVFGTSGGALAYFRRDGAAFTQQTGAANPFSAISGQIAVPAFVDLDKDGDLDLVLGTFNGLQTWRNDGGSFVRTTDIPIQGNGGYFQSPAFADLDGDGDLDMVLGGQFGTFAFLENAGQPITVNVTAEVDPPAPTGSNDSAVAEGGTDAITAAELAYVDEELPQNAVTYTLTTVTVNGSLLLDGVVLAANDTFTQDDVAAGRLTYLHNGGETTSDGFTFTVTDSAGRSTADQAFLIAVTPVNDAPVHSLPGNVTAVEEQETPLHGGIAIDPPLVWIDDADSATITTTLTVADGSLIVDAYGGAVVTGGGTDEVSISGSPDAVNRTVYYGTRYLPAIDVTGSRTITVTTTDGDETVSSDIAVTILGIPEAPEGSDLTAQAEEDTPYVLGADDFGFSDRDGDQLGAVIIESLSEHGRLVDIGGYTSNLDITGDGVPDVVVAAPPRDLAAGDRIDRALLDGGYIRFIPFADQNGAAADSFTFSVIDDSDDGPGGGGQQSPATYTLTFDIAAVNDAPVNMVPGPQVTDEDTPLTITGVSIDDVDLEGGPITVTLTVMNGTLDLVDDSAIIGLVTGQGTDTLVITCQPVLINQALASGIIYTPDPDYAGSDTLTVTTNDGGATGADPGGSDPFSEESVDTVAITINAVNDAPQIDVEDDRVDVAEGDDLVFSLANLNAILIDDVDDDSITVTLSVLNGTLTLAQADGLSVTGDGGGSVVLTGAPADIGAALNGLIYRGNPGFTGADRLTIVADDGEASVQSEVGIAIYAAGTAGDDDLLGTPDPDYFDLQQGGNDRVRGLDSNDGFFFGDAFAPGDMVDGGGGDGDELGLRGSYDLVIDGTMLSNVEVVALLSGTDTSFGGPGGLEYDYILTILDGVVAPGAVLTINANGLTFGEDFTFDGTDESDGSFRIFGGFGVESLTGGSRSDGFFFGEGRFTTAEPDYDKVDGFEGDDDQLALRGDYTGFSELVFLSDSIRNIDTIALISSQDPRYAPEAFPFAYEITTHDDNVAAGARLTVNGNGLLPTEYITFDGSAETDGSFFLIGGGCDDFLIGGEQDDILYGNQGSDILFGNLGNDRFVYLDATESSEPFFDIIGDFEAGDIIDLSRIDANGDPLDGDQAFTFIDCGCFSGTAGELRAFDTGVEGVWLVEGDVNGDGDADFAIAVFRLDMAPFAATDFAL